MKNSKNDVIDLLIDQQLDRHFIISYLFSPQNIYGGHMEFDNDSIFIGCSEMIDRIVNNVYNSKIHTFYHSDFPGVEHFFDKITINFYDTDNVSQIEFAGIFTHELTYAHDNYIDRKKLRKNIFTDEEKNTLVLDAVDFIMNNTDELPKEDHKIINELSTQARLAYLLDTYAINAFKPELISIEFKTKNEFIDNIKQLTSYKLYRDLYKLSLTDDFLYNYNIDLIQKAWKKIISCSFLYWAQLKEDECTSREGRKIKSDWLYYFDPSTPVWLRIK